MKIIDKIKNDYVGLPDLKIRVINNIYVVYLETLCSSDRINNYILKNLTKNRFAKDINNIIPTPNFKNIDYEEVENYIFNGFAILIIKNKIYALETKADLDRSISQPQIEASLYGPKDCFIENYQKNIGLIKRRLKSSKVKIKEYQIGKYSQTKTGLIYINNITKNDLVLKIDGLLKKIDVDAIVDAGELKIFLTNENKNSFPASKVTERPDVIVNGLLEGKIAIVVDNSPFVILLPAVFVDFINPVSDKYNKSDNINILKIIRILSFIITIITPAAYIAVINYNQETIPAKLLTSFITQREGVPFPAAIEAIFMLIISDILKESDIRFPTSYGSSISILGALVLGEAAVAASIVSPIMIIVIALTFISSMIFNETEFINAIRLWRLIFLGFAIFYGIYGITLAFLLFIINICSYEPFTVPYSFPISPFNLPYIENTIIKVKNRNNKKRSSYLTDNIRKQG